MYVTVIQKAHGCKPNIVLLGVLVLGNNFHTKLWSDHPKTLNFSTNVPTLNCVLLLMLYAV